MLSAINDGRNCDCYIVCGSFDIFCLGLLHLVIKVSPPKLVHRVTHKVVTCQRPMAVRDLFL